MRRPYIAVLLILPLIAFFIFSKSDQPTKNKNITSANFELKKNSLKYKKEYLQLKAIINFLKPTIKNSKSLLDSAKITVSKNNKLVATYYSNAKGKCSFKLPLDAGVFKIDITKKGFVTKFIEVNSKVSKGKRGEFTFPFEMDLFMQAPGLDISILKQPIAKIEYNQVYDQFDYDFYYTSNMNQELLKLHENYYFLQKIDRDIDSIPNSKGKK